MSRLEIEQTLLEMIYAPNGSSREGVAIAKAAGITQRAFLSSDHRILWCIAANALTTRIAAIAATKAKDRQMIVSAPVSQIIDSWYWSPSSLRRQAVKLRERALRSSVGDINVDASIAQLEEVA